LLIKPSRRAIRRPQMPLTQFDIPDARHNAHPCSGRFVKCPQQLRPAITEQAQGVQRAALVATPRAQGVVAASGCAGPRPEASDLTSDYNPRFHQTQRDRIRLPYPPRPAGTRPSATVSDEAALHGAQKVTAGHVNLEDGKANLQDMTSTSQCRVRRRRCPERTTVCAGPCEHHR
jgi:hypothetical protein